MSVMIDTSAWIEFFNKSNSTFSQEVASLLKQEKEKVVLCPPVMQEILQGIKSNDYFEQVKDYLIGFDILTEDAVELAFLSATIYRTLRKNGKTIKSMDAVIAAYCLKARCSILHRDEDFRHIARYFPLKIFEKK